MIEISSLVSVEEKQSAQSGSSSKSKSKHKPPAIQEVYEHFAHLYIRYIQVLLKLEDCHDVMTQPQKCNDCKGVLELVIAKVIELKHLLVKWMPPNPDCRVRQKGQQQPPFPWEYVDLNDELQNIEITHESIELTAPRYFLSAGAIHRQRRDKLVKGYMKMKLGQEESFLDVNSEEQCSVEKSPYRPIVTNNQSYESKCKEKRTEMKRLQQNNANAYESALSEIKDAIMNEVISIRQRFTDERTKWITDQVAEGKEIPDSLKGFYQSTTIGYESSSTGDEMNVKASSGKDGMNKDGKDSEEFEVPSFDTTSRNTWALKDCITHFENIWLHHLNEGESQQQFDLDLARQKVRKEVESHIVEEVDEKMDKDLKKLIIIHSNEKKGKKSRAAKSSKQKKKGKKGKLLPGLKIGNMKSMDTDQMLSLLIENNMVSTVRDIKIKDILGDFSVSGSIRQEAQKRRVRRV